MIERHIEKIVLGICVLVLLYAVFYWAFSSPLEIEVIANSRGGNTRVSPSQVDTALLGTAEDIERQARVVTPDPYEVRDYARILKRMQNQPFPPTASQVVIASPGAPFELLGKSSGGELVKTSLKEILGRVPKPGKPAVAVNLEFTQKGEESVDVLASHVAATFPWSKLREQWTKLLEKTTVPSDIVVVRVDAEIRERRLDGEWGPARIVKMTRFPRSSGGTEENPPTPPGFDGNNIEQVHQTVRELVDRWQEEILEPDYWDIWWATQEWGTWMVHLPSNPVSDKLTKKDEPEEQKKGPSPKRPPLRTTGRGLRSKYGADRGTMMREMMMEDEMASRKFGARRSRRAPQARKFEPRDRRRYPRESARIPSDIAPPQVTPVPPLRDQLEDGTVLFWFHHTELEGLKEYQYRVRLVLANPLVTFSECVKDPNDAKQPLVMTEFSDWSDPFTVPLMTEFFVTSFVESMGSVRVDVFTRGRGQLFMKRFPVAEGELIGGEASVRVPDPDSGALESKTMNFSTGAVAVRFDFTKTAKKRNVKIPTVEMVYVDARGQLRTRVQATDKEDSRYKQLKEETERFKAAAESAAGLGR